MAWDTRAWSFFVYMIAACMFIASLCTPYKLKSFYVYYGPEDGLWSGIENPQGFHTAVRALMVIALIGVIITGISYIIIFKRMISIVHVLSFIAQIITGIFAVIAGAIYMANSENIKGDGMWMSLCTGLIFIINGVVIALIPITQFEIGNKRYSEDDMLEAAQERSHRVKTVSGTVEEQVPLKNDPEVEITPASPPEKNTKM